MKKIILAITACVLLSCNEASNSSQLTTKQTANAGEKVGKAFVSFRIGVPLWISEKRCNELFDLFDKYKGVTDEITFFTSATHPPLPLDVFRRGLQF